MTLAALVLASSLARAEVTYCRDLDARERSDDPADRVGLLRNTLWVVVRGYQVLVSPADGAGCKFYPSCSSYALRAVRRRGPLLGTWMATARLSRNHRDPTYPHCVAGGRIYRYDPVEADEWWADSSSR